MYNLSKGGASIVFNWGNRKIKSVNMNGLNENVGTEHCAKAPVVNEHVYT